MDSKTIRNFIREKRLYQWEIAKIIGISEFTLSRWIREELTSERKKKIPISNLNIQKIEYISTRGY